MKETLQQSGTITEPSTLCGCYIFDIQQNNADYNMNCGPYQNENCI